MGKAQGGPSPISGPEAPLRNIGYISFRTQGQPTRAQALKRLGNPSENYKNTKDNKRRQLDLQGTKRRLGTLCYAIMLPGQKSGFRAGFRADSNGESLKEGRARFPARRHHCVT